MAHKIGKGFTGKKHTKETKKKISVANFKGGFPFCINCGIKLKERRSLRCYSCANAGENHPLWLGGKDTYFHKIAKAVYKEHNINIICEQCGNLESICIHHIDENHKNNDIANLQALCRSCHSKKHSEPGRILSEF